MTIFDPCECNECNCFRSDWISVQTCRYDLTLSFIFVSAKKKGRLSARRDGPRFSGADRKIVCDTSCYLIPVFRASCTTKQPRDCLTKWTRGPGTIRNSTWSVCKRRCLVSDRSAIDWSLYRLLDHLRTFPRGTPKSSFIIVCYNCRGVIR